MPSSRPGLISGDAPSSAHSRPLRVAYLINQYPSVTHSFIRREILALERIGVEVCRIAIRGWDAAVVDAADTAETSRTKYVLKDGILRLLSAMARMALTQPRRFASGLGAAVGMSRRSERSFLYHFVYLAQACVILKWLSDTKAQHLHAHFGTNPAEVAMFVRLMGGPPYSFTAHGADETDRGGFLGFDKKVRYSKFVVGVSSYTRSQLLRRCDIADWRKIKVIHCGLDDEYIEGTSSPSTSNKRFVCVGRLSGEKGQLILVEAMQEISRRHPDAELFLVGDGAMREIVEHRIKSLGLEDCVKITGWQTESQVRTQIAAARALVVPSFQEGLPIVIMEAMAVKRTVIATYVAGIPELVLPGENGWLVPAGSVADLVLAMDACLQSPPETLVRMGEAAHARVKARHSVDSEAMKLANCFTEWPEYEQVDICQHLNS